MSTAHPVVSCDYKLGAAAAPASRLGAQRWGEAGVLVIALLCAFAIRVYELDDFPDTILADEADNAQSAVRILHGQTPVNGFFGVDWTAQPAFSAYKEALSIRALGFNVMAMRLPSVISSTLALVPFYLLLRRQLSFAASISGVVLLATDVWYLNFSRSGWNWVDVCLYALAAMAMLMRAFDAVNSPGAVGPGAWLYFGAAGFCCALGLYGYPAGRTITVAVLAFVPVAWACTREHRRSLVAGVVLLLAVECAAFAPQAKFAVANWELFNGRTNVVLIFNDPEFRLHPMAMMGQQISRNIRGPWSGAVNNTAQYSPVREPQLDRPTGLLVLIGMALTLLLARLRRCPATWLWWSMLVVGWSLTQLLTVSTPNGARGIGYMPMFIFFAAVAIDELLRQFRSRTAGGKSVAVRIVPAAAVFAVCAAGFANVRHYVEWQSQPHTRLERYLYVTTREFPAWAAAIEQRARRGESIMNVGQWRDAHPVADWGNPYAQR